MDKLTVHPNSATRPNAPKALGALFGTSGDYCDAQFQPRTNPTSEANNRIGIWLRAPNWLGGSKSQLSMMAGGWNATGNYNGTTKILHCNIGLWYNDSEQLMVPC